MKFLPKSNNKKNLSREGEGDMNHHHHYEDDISDITDLNYNGSSSEVGIGTRGGGGGVGSLLGGGVSKNNNNRLKLEKYSSCSSGGNGGGASGGSTKEGGSTAAFIGTATNNIAVVSLDAVDANEEAGGSSSAKRPMMRQLSEWDRDETFDTVCKESEGKNGTYLYTCSFQDCTQSVCMIRLL